MKSTKSYLDRSMRTIGSTSANTQPQLSALKVQEKIESCGLDSYISLPQIQSPEPRSSQFRDSGFSFKDQHLVKRGCKKLLIQATKQREYETRVARKQYQQQHRFLRNRSHFPVRNQSELVQNDCEFIIESTPKRASGDICANISLKAQVNAAFKTNSFPQISDPLV